MMAALRLLFRHRRILWATTLNEIRGRYAGTILGLAWTVIYPLIFLALYAVVYTMIFKIRIAELSTFEYVLVIFSGLIPFLGFAEAIGCGTTSVVSNKTLIKNTLFPIELIPVKAVLVSSLSMVVGLMLLQGILWIRGTLHLSQLIVPLIFILQVVFTVGLIWLVSALNVFILDLGQIVSVIILFLMLISPIAYTKEMIPKGLLPFMYPNPLFYLTMLYRESMVMGDIPIKFLLVFSTIAIITFFLGYYVFSHLKAVFADYV
jgi:lipopolysaccharide transport system permease protein